MYVLMFMCTFVSFPGQLNSTTARLLVFMTIDGLKNKLLVYDELNDQRERGIIKFRPEVQYPPIF